MKNDKYKIILLWCLIIIAVGCGSVKKTSKLESVTTKSDSIAYVLPSENELIISEICDTLRIASPVELKSQDGPITTSLKLEDNVLKLRVEYDTITVFKDRFIEKEVIREEKKETVKYKWAKITWFFLVVVIVFLFFPSVPRFLNVIVRKSIGL